MKDKPSDQLLQIAQEITFAKALACNDKTLRDRALRRLKKWLISKSNFETGITEDGFIRLWRGLFYNIWMSDKPLVQEEVVEAISNLIHCFSNFSEAQTFIMCFFQTLSESWFGLDSHRLDKYLMLVRRFLRQSFVLAENYEWKNELLMELIASFKKAFLKAPLGLLMHVCEIYLEELAKVTKGKLDEDILLEFIKPFGEIMSTSSDVRLIKHIEEFIYMHLLKQSDLGIKHQIKFKAWRKLGCPEGDINVMEEVEVNSEEESTEELKESNFSLDARAGNVDVFLPPIKFDAIAIADHLNALRKHKNTKTKARKRLTDIINKYKTFVRGKYPLGIHKVELAEFENEEETIESAAMELLEDELETYNEEKLRKPVKKKAKKEELSPTGEWIVTPLKESALSNKGVKSPRNICNNWKVSKISDTPGATNDSMNLREDNLTPVSVNGKNELKKKKKILKTSKRVSPDKDQFHVNNSEELEKQINITTTNEWGDVTWDDQLQTEILVEPKKKYKQTPDLSLKKKSTQNQPNGNKKVKTCTPSSGKKVEFVLNRNSVQAEEDYKLSLKKNPVLKFNSEAQPPVGVLKSTPFSSPINPEIQNKTMNELTLDKLTSKDVKSNEQLKLHSIDQQLEGRPIERALHLISFGEEVQKLSVIQALPDLLAVDRTGCLQKILPKMQQALINGSTEVHVTASLAVRAIIADNVLPVEIFIRHFLHTITQAMDSRDPAVAVSWSDTLLEAIKILPDNVIQGEIVPLAVSRAQLVKPVPIRVSSCKLLGELAVKYDAQTFKRDLMPTVISLCQDVSGDVRAEMAKQLVKIAPKLGPDLIKSNITQPLIELSSDDIALVKENTFVTVVETLPYFTTDSLKSTVLPLLKQMIVLAFKMDDSLLVTISSFFGKMCLGVEKFITESEKDLYIKWYATLAVIGVNQSKKDARVTDRRGEETHQDVESSPNHRYTLCRKNCAHTFPAMAKFTHDVAKKTTFEFLHNTLKLLVSDPCYVVRKSIAGVFNEVCLIYWKYCNFLKDDFITLCKDDSVDVLDGILPNLYSIMEIFTHNDIFKPDSHDEVLSNLMRTLVKTEMTLNKGHRWRSYLLFIEQTRNFYRFVPSDMLYNTLILSCLKITTISRVVPVRLAAMKNLLLYLRYSTRPQQRKEMKDKIVSEFCLSKNFYDRIIYVRILPTIMEIFSTFYFKEHFFLSTIHLFSDPVPNIRCALVGLLPKLKGMLRLPSDNKLNSMLEATFSYLEEDKDRETKRIFLSVKDTLEETDMSKLFPDDVKKHEEEKRLFTEKKEDLSQKGGKSPRPQQKKKPISAQTTPQTQQIEQRNVPGTVTPPGTTLRPPGRPPPARPRNVNRLRGREMSGQEKEFYVDAGVHLPGGVQQLSIVSSTSINNNNNSLKRWDNSSHRIPVRRPNTQRHSLEFTDFNKNITITDKSTTSSLGATTIRHNNHRSHLPRPLSCINFQTTGTTNKSDSTTIPTNVSANSPSKQRHISKLPVINRSSSESHKVQRKSS